MFKFAVVAVLLGVAQCKEFIFVNQHSDTIWVGTLGNAGLAAPSNGGFSLAAGEQKSISTDDSWAGRFWGRTGCNSGTQHCDSGDCGNKLECAGAGGIPPVTLIEFTLNGWQGLDYYDVSLVDGFNVAAQAQPVNKGVGSSQYDCGTAGCTANLDPGCPEQLKVYGSSGSVVACSSSCTKYATDQYCCRNAYGTPATCNINDWAVNSASYFKANCPGAYSYAYDDTTSTYTCTDSAYRITFH
ncbi:hypothetical protein L9F63_020608 [Diploptera punctata]|uniref:Thaumatin-like protein n=1 Tax=Diploptera punctata TaxID=6984 RepID=A0AAD7ZSI9_DIPPU|nr:hypothetical protein L9F63_020608 [Diploptera punctata]